MVIGAVQRAHTVHTVGVLARCDKVSRLCWREQVSTMLSADPPRLCGQFSSNLFSASPVATRKKKVGPRLSSPRAATPDRINRIIVDCAFVGPAGTSRGPVPGRSENYLEAGAAIFTWATPVSSSILAGPPTSPRPPLWADLRSLATKETGPLSFIAFFPARFHIPFIHHDLGTESPSFFQDGQQQIHLWPSGRSNPPPSPIACPANRHLPHIHHLPSFVKATMSKTIRVEASTILSSSFYPLGPCFPSPTFGSTKYQRYLPDSDGELLAVH